MQSFHFSAGWMIAVNVPIRDCVEKLSHFKYSSLRVNFFSLFQEQKPEDNQDDAVDPEGDEGVRFDKLEQKFDGQQSHDKGRDEANQEILNLVEGKL
jgi:hypothetical protein